MGGGCAESCGPGGGVSLCRCRWGLGWSKTLAGVRRRIFGDPNTFKDPKLRAGPKRRLQGAGQLAEREEQREGQQQQAQASLQDLLRRRHLLAPDGKPAAGGEAPQVPDPLLPAPGSKAAAGGEEPQNPAPPRPAAGKPAAAKPPRGKCRGLRAGGGLATDMAAAVAGRQGERGSVHSPSASCAGRALEPVQAHPGTA